MRIKFDTAEKDIAERKSSLEEAQRANIFEMTAHLCPGLLLFYALFGGLQAALFDGD